VPCASSESIAALRVCVSVVPLHTGQQMLGETEVGTAQFKDGHLSW